MSDYKSTYSEIVESIDGVTNAIDLLRDELPTVRDRFAMAALQGVLSANRPTAVHEMVKRPEEVAKLLSSFSYKIADAMLAEREKTP